MYLELIFFAAALKAWQADTYCVENFQVRTRVRMIKLEGHSIANHAEYLQIFTLLLMESE